MPNQVRIDRRILGAFMIAMLAMNAAVFLLSWKAIMAGKNDFPTFYASAQMVRDGQASQMYNFDAENSFVHRISEITRPPNNHLPYELLIFVPFTYLRFGVSYLLWTSLGLGMLIGIALLTREVWPTELGFWFTLLTILAFFPVWYCLLQGQDSILLTFVFAFSFWWWRRRHEGAAGFVLALGLFRPQLVAPFVLLAFLGGKWKFVRGFIPGAVLVIALSTWVVGFHGLADYAQILILQGTQGSARTLVEQWRVHPGLMPTWRGLLWMSLPSRGMGDIQKFLLLSGTIGAWLWAAARMRRAKDGAAFGLAFAVAVAVVTLVSFHSLLHDFSLMILPVLIAGGALTSSMQIADRSAYATVTIAFLFFFTPLYIVLLFTDKVGLFVLPTVALLWLMSSCQRGSLPVLKAEPSSAEPISILAAQRTAI